MPNLPSILKSLGNEINEVNRANGWRVTQPGDWDDDGPVGRYKIPAIIALIHSEASEALEAFRKSDLDNFSEEMADIIIRVLDVCNGLNLDIGQSVLDKLEKNRHRSFRHGGKKV